MDNALAIADAELPIFSKHAQAVANQLEHRWEFYDKLDQQICNFLPYPLDQ